MQFSFWSVEVEDVYRKVDSIDAYKVIQKNDIQVKIIKANCDIFYEFITRSFNEVISTARFPDILKSAEVKPVFKKKLRIDKENYSPVSILPVIPAVPAFYLKFLKDWYLSN